MAFKCHENPKSRYYIPPAGRPLLWEELILFCCPIALGMCCKILPLSLSSLSMKSYKEEKKPEPSSVYN